MVSLKLKFVLDRYVFCRGNEWRVKHLAKQGPRKYAILNATRFSPQ